MVVPISFVIRLALMAVFSILALRFKKSKILFYAVFFTCWVLMVLTTDSYDINNYRRMYENMISLGKEWVFDTLSLSCSRLGMDFEMFRVVWETFLLLAVFITIGRITDYSVPAVVLFFIMPFCNFTTQMRSSMASAFVIFGYYYLIRNKKSGLIIYLISTIAGALFHRMALFYLVLVLPVFFAKNNRRYRIITYSVVAAAMTVMALMLPRMTHIILRMRRMPIFAPFEDILKRITYYFSQSFRANTTGFLFNLCWHLVVYVCTELSCIFMLKKAEKGGTRYNSGQIRLVRRINDTMLILCPFYMASVQFDRFLCGYLPLVYGIVTQALAEQKKKTREYRWMIAVLLLLFVCTFFVYCVDIYILLR